MAAPHCPHLLGRAFHHSTHSSCGPVRRVPPRSRSHAVIASAGTATRNRDPDGCKESGGRNHPRRSAQFAASGLRSGTARWILPRMETPLDVLSRAASLVHADDEKREAALRAEPRMQSIQMSSAVTNHRTGPPPISPSKRKYSGDQADDEIDCDNEHVAKMSRLFAAQLGKPVNGDYRKDHRDRSRSPIERAAAPAMSIHANHMYAPVPNLAMDQPLALTKNSMDAARTVSISPTLGPIERQQNRPSVITCASANNRNCNLSYCPVSHNGCTSSLPSNFRRPSNTACDPVIEEHFRRSLGKNYKEPEPVTNSVSITGSVDDHFAKALGETWLQIKAAKGSVSGSPESASRRGQSPPSSHMVNHNHSPSVVS